MVTIHIFTTQMFKLKCSQLKCSNSNVHNSNVHNSLRTEGVVVVPMLLHWAGQGVSVDFWWPGGGDLLGLGGWSFSVGVGSTDLM